jgi:hypothetical protein
MGKVKQVIHSLRSRWVPSTSNTFTVKPGVKLSAILAFQLSGSSHDVNSMTSTLEVEASSLSETLVPSTAQTQSCAMQEADANSFDRTDAGDKAETNGKSDQCANPQHPGLSARATLEVHASMLSLVKKLPLEELSMIGHGWKSSLPTTADARHSMGLQSNVVEVATEPQLASSSTLSVKSTNSSSSFACRSARRMEQGCERETLPDCAHEPPCSSSRTLTLSNRSSKSTWSFACQSARRVERRVSVACSSAPPTSKNFGSPSPQDKRWTFMSDAEFDALPDWSDVEDEAEYNTPFVSEADFWFAKLGDSLSVDEDMRMPLMMPDLDEHTGSHRRILPTAHRVLVAYDDGVEEDLSEVIKFSKRTLGQNIENPAVIVAEGERRADDVR